MRSSQRRWPRLQALQAAATAELVLILLVGASSSTETGCDVTIYSRDLHNKTGKFSSPNYPEDYGNHLHCIYKFIGRPHEKVKIKFTFFEVKGIRPSMSSGEKGKAVQAWSSPVKVETNGLRRPQTSVAGTHRSGRDKAAPAHARICCAEAIFTPGRCSTI